MRPIHRRVGQVVRGAAAAIEAQRQRIDDLNVYPVPDGDTGSNMAQTVRRVVEDLAAAPDTETPQALAQRITRAALVGARGNSGVILSQIVRGFVGALPSEPPLNADGLAAAFRGAADAGYGAVKTPVEGTILTVIREMAEEAEAARDESVERSLDRIVARGEDALARTPDMLATLRDAGVVDAGGAGLLELVRGAVAAMRGQTPAGPAPADPGPPILDGHGEGEQSRYRYCTGFLISGSGDLDVDGLHALFEPLGDSLLVVGDGQAVRVHVHTDDPGAALSVGVRHGGVSGVEISDMRAQVQERRERLAEPPAPTSVRRRCDVVAVMQGDGNEALARQRGARAIVPGGQTLNPSTEQILAAIDSCNADEVVLLPNNDNIVMTARSAAALAQRPVIVVETRSMPEGLLALDAYTAGQSAEDNGSAMRAAAAKVATGAITRASRDARVDGVPVVGGQWMGLVDGRLVATSPRLTEVASRVVTAMLTPARRSLLALVGDTDAPDQEIDAALAAITQAYPDVRVERRDGGQLHYPLLLAAHHGERTLSAATTAIVIDSTADIAISSRTHPSWRMVPLTVRFGDDEYLDKVTITGDDFYRLLRSRSDLPRTAAPPPGAFEETYRDLLERYRDVISIHISERLSSTVDSAQAGASMLGERVSVHDSRAACSLLALAAEGVQRMLDRGTTLSEVDAYIRSVPARGGIAFSVDSLEYLQRNGRIGRASALLGGILRVRPILALVDGEVAPVRRVHGNRAVIPALVDNMVRRSAGLEHLDVVILNGDAPDRAVRLEKAVREARGGILSLRHVSIGPVIGAHIGPGALGVAFLAREDSR